MEREIINGWAERLLHNLADIGSGTSISAEDRKGTVPIMGANGPIGNTDRTNFGPGFLVGRVGAAGAVNFTVGPCWASDNTLTVYPRANLCDMRFLGHLLAFLRPEQLATRNAQPLVTQTNLGNLRAQVPVELPEQQKIAEILDTVDDAIRKTDQLIAKLEQVKQGLLHDLLTRGIDDNGELRDPERHPEQFKETVLGRIPKKWNVDSFGDVCESSAFGPRFSSEHYSPDGDLATLRTTDMDDYGNIDLSTMPRASISPASLASHLLEEGDLLISRSGTCGIAAVFPGHSMPVVPGAFLIRFRLVDRVHSDYLRRYFNSGLGQPRLAQLAVGGVQKNLKGTEILAMFVPMPKLQESRQIVAAIEAHEKFTDYEVHYLRKLRLLKQGLMDDLLTGRVRVTHLLEKTPE